MKLTATHLEPILKAVALISIVILLWSGPTRVSDKTGDVHVVPGRVIARKPSFAAQRNFINYSAQPSQTSMSRSAVEGLGNRFGVSSDAIFNANGQRGKPSLVTDLHHIRIPL